MKITKSPSLAKRGHSDLLILPFWKTKSKPTPAAKLGKLEEVVEAPIAAGDFDGSLGTFSAVYTGSKNEPRIMLLGLGEEEEITTERLRRATGSTVKWCHKHKAAKVSYLFHPVKGMADVAVARGLTEGFLLPNYSFNHKTDPKTAKQTLITELDYIDIDPKALHVAEETAVVAASVYMARDLINGNADDVTPQYLAKTAKDISKKYKSVKTTVLTKKQIEAEKMGLLLAVSRGAVHEPVVIIMQYKGDPKSKDTTVMVGKGVTYDTGGLNLKPTGSMETMKCDMSGAAAGLGTMEAVARLKLKVNLTVVIPATENAIDAHSYKPGDVYKSYAGKTVEIGNTDAEGRLILADAVAYAVKKFKPSRIIDFATLTGAIVISLGNEAAGLFSTNDALADGLMRSGIHTYERCWRMPLFDEYKEQLKSEIADMKNVGGRGGGSITGALFIGNFVGDTPWAHVDIAGVAYLDKPNQYIPAHGTGFGIRLMVDFLRNL
jgi:leucyl aminopeptidase